MSKTKRLIGPDVNEQSLYLEDVVVEDTGNITCVAENIAGRAYQDPRLIINGYINMQFTKLHYYIIFQTCIYSPAKDYSI